MARCLKRLAGYLGLRLTMVGAAGAVIATVANLLGADHGWWHLAVFGVCVPVGYWISVAARSLEKRWGWR